MGRGARSHNRHGESRQSGGLAGGSRSRGGAAGGVRAPTAAQVRLAAKRKLPASARRYACAWAAHGASSCSSAVCGRRGTSVLRSEEGVLNEQADHGVGVLGGVGGGAGQGRRQDEESAARRSAPTHCWHNRSTPLWQRAARPPATPPPPPTPPTPRHPAPAPTHHVCCGAAVLQVALARQLDRQRDADGGAAVGHTKAEGVDVAGLCGRGWRGTEWARQAGERRGSAMVAAGASDGDVVGHLAGMCTRRAPRRRRRLRAASLMTLRCRPSVQYTPSVARRPHTPALRSAPPVKSHRACRSGGPRCRFRTG